MRRDWKLAAGTVAIAGALAWPAASTAIPARPALAIGPLATCYDATGPKGVDIPVTLTGGGPADGYDLYAADPGGDAGSAATAGGTFDANGDAMATLTGVVVPGNPTGPTAGRHITLSVSDFAATGTVSMPLGTVTVSEEGLAVASGSSNPRARREVTLANASFAGKLVDGFITNRAGTKVLSRFSLGRADPTCGYLRHPAVVAPPKLVAGTYDFVVNPGSKLNKRDSMSQQFRIESGF